MALQKLTTLGLFKSWAGIPDDSSDLLITRLIDRVSQGIITYLNRDSIFLTSYTEYRDGTGSQRMTLRNYPVQSVSALSIWNQVIPATSLPGSVSGSCSRGFFCPPPTPFPPGSPSQLVLVGYSFNAPPLGVAVTYQAGYAVLAEPQSVPAVASPSLRVNEPYGRFGRDEGVSYSIGGALTKVASNADLSQGQYYVDPVQGIYYFSAADASAPVLISYSYIPADIEQACMEWMQDRYEYKSRVGVKSKSLGGQETVSFDVNAMPKNVMQMLRAYRKLIL